MLKCVCCQQEGGFPENTGWTHGSETKTIDAIWIEATLRFQQLKILNIPSMLSNIIL